jgi:hypothetical protein
MLMTKKDNIADILGVSPISTIRENNVVIYEEPTENDKEVDRDIAYARTMMYDTIKLAHDAVEEMVDIAKQSQHPRAFEVVATLLNTMREANKDLIDLHKKKKEIKKDEAGKGPDVVNNNLFVGSTSEMLKMIKDNQHNDG